MHPAAQWPVAKCSLPMKREEAAEECARSSADRANEWNTDKFSGRVIQESGQTGPYRTASAHKGNEG